MEKQKKVGDHKIIAVDEVCYALGVEIARELKLKHCKPWPGEDFGDGVVTPVMLMFTDKLTGQSFHVYQDELRIEKVLEKLNGVRDRYGERRHEKVVLHD